jgi:hypothetical protein
MLCISTDCGWGLRGPRALIEYAHKSLVHATMGEKKSWTTLERVRSLRSSTGKQPGMTARRVKKGIFEARPRCDAFAAAVNVAAALC